MASMAYRFGRSLAQYKLSYAVLAGFVVISIYAIAKDPDPLKKPVAPKPVQAAPLAAIQPDPLAKICGDEMPGRLASAKDAMRKKDYDKAYELLDPCSPRFERGSEQHGLHLKAAGEIGKRIDKENAEQKRKTLAEYKKQGVVIGMTSERVLQSSWGKPERVNRTTTASGVREQWVYGGRNYLYFENDVLTSIQN